METCAIFEVTSVVWFLLISFVSANAASTPQPPDLYHVGRSSLRQRVPPNTGWDREWCHLQAKIGECRASFRKFYYDINDGRCKNFTYGGCSGNMNRFDSGAICDKICRGSEEIKNPYLPDDEWSFCEWQPNRGPCFGSIPQYYYDVNDKFCKVFTYGGCGGNDNRFPDYGSCFRKCAGSRQIYG